MKLIKKIAEKIEKENEEFEEEFDVKEAIKLGNKKGMCPNCLTEKRKPLMSKYTNCKKCGHVLKWR